MIGISTLAQEIIMNSKPRSAFTLLELLIVVAIIAVLAGLVLVGVAMLREQSRRIACGNNLRSWGLCAIAAATDNQGALLASYYEGMTSAVRPQLVAVNDSAWVRNMRVYKMDQYIHPMARNQFTIVKAAQYMDGGERVLQTLADTMGTTVAMLIGSDTSPERDGSYAINVANKHVDLPVGSFNSWRCPSQRAGFFVNPANEMGSEGSRASSYVQGMGYSYFARTDQWRFSYAYRTDGASPVAVGGAPLKGIMMYTDAQPTILRDQQTEFDAYENVNGINALCARSPLGDRILMSETLMYDGNSGDDQFNGQSRLTGPNHIKTFGTIDKRGDLNAMTGNYVLMGDGRVSWRSKSTWDLAKMTAAQKNGWQTHYLGSVE